LQIAEGLGLTPAVLVPRGDVASQIQAVRTLLSRCWIDTTHCHSGLEALKAYRREWSETRRTWMDTPVHDWASHGASALATFAVGWEGERQPPRKHVQVPVGPGRRGGGWRNTFTG
jgi:hypothetical protein